MNETFQFIEGTEKIPAYCQQYDSANDYSDASTALKNHFEWQLMKKAEANQTDSRIRIGCPANYKIFGEFYCVPVDYLEQYKIGLTWLYNSS